MFCTPIRLAPLFLLLASLPATAQSGRKVMLRTLCFQHVDDIRNVLVVSGGENPKTTGVELWTDSFSDQVEVEITGDTLLFAVEKTAPDGATKLKTIAKGKAHPGKSQLALFFPGKPNGLTYRLVVLDDSEQSFPMGSTILLNLAPVPVRFDIGEHQRALKSGDRGIVPLPRKVNKMNQCNVLIAFGAADNTWTTVNNTRWLALDLKRGIAVSFVDAKTRQPTVKLYQDTPPWRMPKF